MFIYVLLSFIFRACRLKKKAQHEAYKIKLHGLDMEHKQLLQITVDMKKKFAVVLENTLPGRLNVKQEGADNLQMTEYLENMTEKEYSKYNMEEFYCMRLKKGGLNFQDIKMHSKKINVTMHLKQKASFFFNQLDSSVFPSHLL